MQLTIEKTKFKDALDLVAPAMETRSPLPILANVRLQGDGDVLTVAATDMEMAIQKLVECHCALSGDVTVYGALLRELVGAIPGNSVEVRLEGTELFVSGGKAQFKLPTLSAAEFPVLPKVEGSQGVIQIPPGYGTSLRSICGFASEDPTRPSLLGIHHRIRKDALILQATDTHRVGIFVIEGLDEAESECLLPARSLRTVARVVESEKDVLLKWDENAAQYEGEDFVIQLRRLAAAFPNTEKIIPQNPTFELVFEKDQILEVVKRAALVAREGTRSVYFQFPREACAYTMDAVTIRANEPNVGNVEETIAAELRRPVTYDPADEEAPFPKVLAVNAGYMIQAIEAMPSSYIVLDGTTERRPFRIHPDGDTLTMAVVMPLVG